MPASAASIAGWSQHHQGVERESAAFAYQERVDVDGVDHIAEVVRQAAEIDQRIEQGLAVAQFAAAEAVDQAAGTGGLDHRERLIAIEAGGRETYILEQFDEDAAEAEHDDRPHLGVAAYAEHTLGAAGDLLRDQDAVERGVELHATPAELRERGLHRGIIVQIEQHEASGAL